ncbi:MAG: hypothetical protein KKB20_29190 [Proteobacteria bacterium]|nr:hypothetical protein [Pseudomonadota bacterium]
MTRLDDPSVMDDLAERAAAWVREQREKHRPGARPLDLREKRAFGGFFNSRVLDSARIALVPLIENPDFYDELPGLGLKEALDLTGALGIAYRDVILVSRRHYGAFTPWLPLVFHELVHVSQYDLLGPERFMRQYVRGWAENGFRYSGIPLEVQAYELQARYQSGSGRIFNVDKELGRRLGLFPGD